MPFPRESASDAFSFLPKQLRRDLELHCRVTKEAPADVIADALALHFDALEGNALEDEPAREAAP